MFNMVWAFGGWDPELDEAVGGGANLRVTDTAIEARDCLMKEREKAETMVECEVYLPGELVVTDAENRRIDVYAEAAREELVRLGLIDRESPEPRGSPQLAAAVA